MNVRKVGPVGAPHVAPEVPAAEPAERERDARADLAERAELLNVAEIQAPALDAVAAADAAADTTAIVRFGFLVLLYTRVKRGRAGRADVDEKRRRIDPRASRMGARLGPRLASLLGGALFWVGVLGEAGTETLEELIDGELEERAKAAADAKASP